MLLLPRMALPRRWSWPDTGLEALVHLVPQLFVSPGDEVVLADVTYTVYRQASMLMDASLRVVPLRDFRHDLAGHGEGGDAENEAGVDLQSKQPHRHHRVST